MEMFGRQVIPTTLDPVPPRFRTVPGYVVINHVEAAAIAAGDGQTFKRLMAICADEDLADLRRLYGRRATR